MKRLPNFLLMMLTTVLLATFITSCSESGSDSDPSTTPTQPQTPVSDGDWQVVPATGGTIEKGDITITFPSGTFNKDTKIAITEVKKGETCGEYEASKFYQLTTPAKLDKPISVSIKSEEQADDIRFMTVAQALEKSTYELVQQDVSFDADYSNSKYHFTLPATKNDEDDGNTYLTMGLAHYPSGDDVNGTRTGTRYIMEGQVGNIEWYYEPSWLLTSKQKSLYNRLKPKINQYVIEALKQIQALGFSTRSSRKIPIHFVNDFLFGKDAFGFFEQHTLYDEWNVVKINMCKFSDLYDKDGEEAFLAQLKRTTIHELFHYYQSEYDPRSPIKKAFSPGEENILCEAGSVWIEQFVNDGQLDGNFVSQYLPSYRKSLYNYRECWKLDSENNKTFVKMTAAHGYGMSSLLYYMTSPISEMKGTFGIDKMEIVKLYKKWKTYTTKTFEPLESWLRDYDAWDSFSRYKYDEYLLTMLCGDLIPGINEGIITTSETSTNLLTNTDGKYERKMPCLTYGCDLLSCNFTSYKNEKGENSFEGKEIVIKQLNPDFKTYVIARGTKRKQIGGVLEEGDSMVIAGENVKNLLGDGKVNYLNIVSVNHSSNTKDSHVTFEIRNKQINASVSPTELTFPAEGNTQSVKVTAQGFTRYNHKISDEYKEWLSAKNNPAGKMDITVQPNTTGKERIGYVRVYVFNDENPTEAQKVYLKDSIKVTQAANKEEEQQQEFEFELVSGSVNMYYAVLWRWTKDFKAGDDGVTITPNGKGAKVVINQEGTDLTFTWHSTISFEIDDLSLNESNQARISHFRFELEKDVIPYQYYDFHIDSGHELTRMVSPAPKPSYIGGLWTYSKDDLSYYSKSTIHYDKWRKDYYSAYVEHTEESETSEVTDGSSISISLYIKKK